MKRWISFFVFFCSASWAFAGCERAYTYVYANYERYGEERVLLHSNVVWQEKQWGDRRPVDRFNKALEAKDIKLTNSVNEAKCFDSREKAEEDLRALPKRLGHSKSREIYIGSE